MSAHVFDCPQCGAVVKFQSSISVFAVCSYCRSMVVRRTMDVEALGTMAELPPDLSPLQLGSRGRWQDQGFELVGRIRITWEQGSWNEWYAVFDNGKSGWLADAQGFFTVGVERFDREVPTEMARYQPGQSLQFVERGWTVADVKTAVCVAAEGELPFTAPAGSKRISADLMAPDGSFATVEFGAEERPRLYVGRYHRFDELEFQNLRPVPGWSAEAEAQRHRTGALNCPECGAPVDLRAVGQVVSAVCGSCGAVMDTSAPLLRMIQHADARVKELRPLLPLGTRGKLLGVEWEVVGFVRRGDRYCTWSEYLLFNPWQGFRWLVNYEGHWSLIDRLLKTPTVIGNRVRLDGESFDLFAKGDAEVRGVLGEFYWKVRRGERTQVCDYVHPPRILSSEQYPDLKEITWSMGEYIDGQAIGEAFGVKNLPGPNGVYLNQPNPHAVRWMSLRPIFALSLALFVLIEGGSCSVMKREAAFNSAFMFDRNDPSKVEVSAPFRVLGWQRPIEIEASTDVSNSWLGLDVTLVNAQTNEQFFATFDLEYYFGVEDGERWTEGQRRRSVMIPAVPPGEYYLTVETDADPELQRAAYTVQVSRGGLFWSNFWLGFVLICFYPLSLVIRAHVFERERWEDSDYSPYTKSDD